MEDKKSKKISITSLVVLIIVIFFIVAYFEDAETIPERLSLRTTGPFHFRLIMQPIAAILLGVKDGFSDAKSGVKPYFLQLITNKGDFNQNIKLGLKSLMIPLSIGVLLDAIFQMLIFDRLHIIGAIIFGLILIGLPYSLFRGIANRYKSTSINKTNP